MNTCGLCRFWNPGEPSQTGSLTYRKKEPHCTQILDKGKPVVRYAETKGCWLWKGEGGGG